MRPAPLRTALALLPALAFGSCSLQMGSERGEGEDATVGAIARREATRVRVVAVERRELVRKITTAQEVQSEQQVAVVPRATGIVTEILVEEGDRVVAGQVLARLDRREAEAAVAEARIALQEALDGEGRFQLARRQAEAALAGRTLALEQAERDFARNETTGLISQQDLEKLRLARDTALAERKQQELVLESAENDVRTSRTAVERAEVALARAELNLSYTELTAPFEGVIAERAIQVGQSVGAQGEAFTLFDPDRLRIVFTRPQRELAIFRPDLREERLTDLVGGGSNGAGAAHGALELVARAEALPDLVFPGRIVRVSPGIDPSSGSFRVTAELSPAGVGEPLLRPGMLVRLDVVVERRPQALAVPKRALRREGELTFLFVADPAQEVGGGARARRVEVEEGLTDDEWAEVRPRGEAVLEAGMDVVIVGSRDLEDGEALTVQVGDALAGDADVGNGE